MIIMAKKFTYKGKELKELEDMTLEEFSKFVPARIRRSLLREFTTSEKKLLKKIRKLKGSDKLIKTHCRDMPVIPEMVGAKLGIYNGQEFKVVTINEEMIAHRLGEFAPTRGKVQHNSPGFGATRSSKFVPLK